MPGLVEQLGPELGLHDQAELDVVTRKESAAVPVTIDGNDGAAHRISQLALYGLETAGGKAGEQDLVASVQQRRVPAERWRALLPPMQRAPRCAGRDLVCRDPAYPATFASNGNDRVRTCVRAAARESSTAGKASAPADDRRDPGQWHSSAFAHSCLFIKRSLAGWAGFKALSIHM